MATTAASTTNIFSLTKLKFNLNENNGVYQHSKAYGLQMCLEVAHAYLCLKDKAGKNVVSMRQLAKETKIGRTFVRKIVHDIEKNGVGITGLQCPPQKQPFGVGIKMLSYKDEVFLLDLCKKNACCSLQSYKNLPQMHRGMIVSKSTLHHWFRNRLKIKIKPPLISSRLKMYLVMPSTLIL